MVLGRGFEPLTFRLSVERSKPNELAEYKTGADNRVRTGDLTLARSCITTILYPHGGVS